MPGRARADGGRVVVGDAAELEVLKEAGIDRASSVFVLSPASMGANAIFNLLRRGNLLFVAEGLDVFSVGMPAELAGRSLAESELREHTGCTVLAVRHAGRMEVRFDVTAPLPADAELILIGDREAEERFLSRYSRG